MKDKIKDTFVIIVFVIVMLVLLVFVSPVMLSDWKILKEFWGL